MSVASMAESPDTCRLLPGGSTVPAGTGTTPDTRVMVPSYGASTGSRSTALRPGRTRATATPVVVSRLPAPSGAAHRSMQADDTSPVTGIENSGRVALPRMPELYVVAVAAAS